MIAQVVVDGGVLRDVADAVPQFGRTCRTAQHRHRALGDDLGADDAAHQRRLAAAGRAEQAGDGAARDLHRDVVQRDALAADDPQILNVDHDVLVTSAE